LACVEVAALVFILPLAGAATAGRPLAPYLQFPPKTPDVPHAPFSVTAFLCLGLLEMGAAWPFLRRALSADAAARRKPSRPLPWWGWAGAAVGAAAWILAWSRFGWMGSLQGHTFTPLWLSFIVVVNALTARRTGRCLLLSRPRRFLLLFPASALFWWSFEYLNRFVGNWRYVGVASFGPWEYFLYSTLPFSTVLPAVLSVRELLLSFPRLDGPFRRWHPLAPARPRLAALTALSLACAGLFAVGIVPEVVFPLVWVAPPLLLLSLAARRGEPHALSGIAGGDWRPAVSAALAALICGFFWEMWNFGSYAKWVYVIPYVDALHVFEMPLLGYVGYLPFGVLCAEVGERVLEEGRPESEKISSVTHQVR
jgi:hypothetical protein